MATASAHPLSASITGRVVYGVVSGLVGGVAFGVLMQLMMPDTVKMIGQLAGSATTGMGWLVHLFNAALFGAIFVLLFSKWTSRFGPAILLGLAYGVLWWVLGALLIMPAWLGMSEMVFVIDAAAVRSLTGHLIYGLLLGGVYAVLARRAQHD